MLVTSAYCWSHRVTNAHYWSQLVTYWSPWLHNIPYLPLSSRSCIGSIPLCTLHRWGNGPSHTWEGSAGTSVSRNLSWRHQQWVSPKSRLIWSVQTSGRPKGLSFGFRPKFLVLVSAETFLQILTFRPKQQFWQKWHISAETTFFQHLSAQFQLNKLINGQNWHIPAKRRLFRPKCLLSVSFWSFG